MVQSFARRGRIIHGTPWAALRVFFFTGYAVYDVNNNNLSILRRTSNQASIFPAEAMAIILALDCAEWDNSTEIFFPILGLSSMLSNNSKSTYQLARLGKRVSFFWVPSHVNSFYNERAKQASTKMFTNRGIETTWKLLYSDLRYVWKSDSHEEFVKFRRE